MKSVTITQSFTRRELVWLIWRFYLVILATWGQCLPFLAVILLIGVSLMPDPNRPNIFFWIFLFILMVMVVRKCSVVLRASLATWREYPRGQNEVVTITNDQFSVSSSGKNFTVRWSSVVKVVPLGTVWALELEGNRVYFLRVTNIRSDVRQIIQSSPTRQKEVVTDAIPPVLTTPDIRCVPNKSANKRRWSRDVLLLLLGLLLGVALVSLGKSVAHFVNLIRPRFDISASSNFHVTILKVQSCTNLFSEKIRVDANGPMQVGVFAADVKSPAFRKDTTGTNSNIFYRKRDPLRVGQAWPLGGTGTNRSCEIYISITTTSSETVWHSKIRGMRTSILFGHEMLHDSLNASLPEPMTVRGIETNWPNEYPVGSAIPLGNLGDYKILLTTTKESSAH